jgi:lysozyme
MRTNAAGVALIKSFESLQLKPYQDEAGIWTAGYGRTRGIGPHSPPITKDTAEQWLADDIEEAEAVVNRWIKVYLSDNQFSALTSMAFNLGSAPFLGTLGKMLNAGNAFGAADQITRWNKVRTGEIDAKGKPAYKTSAGLTRRREAERELFLS